jgi:hypothetical protein
MARIKEPRELVLNYDVVRNLQSADLALVYSEILKLKPHFIQKRVVTIEHLVDLTGLSPTAIYIALTRLVLEECIKIEPTLDSCSISIQLLQRGLMKAYAIKKLNSSTQEVRRYRQEVKEKANIEI